MDKIPPPPHRGRMPGMELRRLPRLRNEDKHEAARRAACEPWWPRVVNRIPYLASGVWCWQIRP